jgi:hypothetical protein
MLAFLVHSVVGGKVNACYARLIFHLLYRRQGFTGTPLAVHLQLALPLLVFGVLTDNIHPAPTPDDLAFRATAFNRRAYFHSLNSFIVRSLVVPDGAKRMTLIPVSQCFKGNELPWPDPQNQRVLI